MKTANMIALYNRSPRLASYGRNVCYGGVFASCPVLWAVAIKSSIQYSAVGDRIRGFTKSKKRVASCTCFVTSPEEKYSIDGTCLLYSDCDIFVILHSCMLWHLVLLLGVLTVSPCEPTVRDSAAKTTDGKNKCEPWFFI